MQSSVFNVAYNHTILLLLCFNRASYKDCHCEHRYVYLLTSTSMNLKIVSSYNINVNVHLSCVLFNEYCFLIIYHVHLNVPRKVSRKVSWESQRV